jgi:hypothetical protein
MADTPGEWRDADDPLRKAAGVSGRCEWTVPSVDCAWICELGSPRLHGSFDRFVKAVSAAVVEGGTDALAYASPSVGEIRAGWSRPTLLDGAVLDGGPFPRFDNPWCRMAFGGEWNLQALEAPVGGGVVR